MDPLIIIIGAGLAGLHTAERLNSSFPSLPITILEARSRVGGRAYASPIDQFGLRVDYGCSWQHGNGTKEEPNPVHTIIKQRNLDVTETKSRTTLGPDHMAERYAYVKDDINRLYDDVVAMDPDSIDPTLSFSDVLERMIIDKSRTERRVYRMVSAKIEGLNAQDLDKQSLVGINKERVFGHENLFIHSTYGWLAETITGELRTKGVEIVLDAKVTGIDFSDSKLLKVRTMHKTYKPAFIVPTIPIGVLKRLIDTNFFTPQLPKPVQSAIRGLGFGNLDKVVLRFKERFWAEKDCSARSIFHLLGPVDLENPQEWDKKQLTFHICGPGDGPHVIVALVHTHDRHMMYQKSKSEVVAYVLSRLRMGFKDVPDPIASDLTQWGRDEFAHGSYISFVPGREDLEKFDHSVLQEPLRSEDGRPCLKMAGEGVSETRFASAHGAILTGWAAADYVIEWLADTYGFRPRQILPTLSSRI